MMRHVIKAAVAVALVAAAGEAQDARTSIVLGGTWLDFSSLGGTVAATGEVRVQKSYVQISAFGLMPIGVTAAYADCIPDAPCFQRSTPSAIFGGLLSLASRPSSSGWRGSVGGGFLGTSGLEWPGDHSSPAVTASLDWAPVGDGLTFTAGVRVVALTSRVASLRAIVLPAVGVSF